MDVNSNHKITISFDDEHPPEDTLRYVAGLVEEGYTSGIDPDWDIVKNEDTQEEKDTDSMKPAMSIQEFILKLGCLGFDISAIYIDYFNDEKHCHLVVTQRTDKDRFFRSKCHVHKIDEMFKDILVAVRESLDKGEA